jgi:hypothetical protein
MIAYETGGGFRHIDQTREKLLGSALFFRSLFIPA